MTIRVSLVGETTGELNVRYFPGLSAAAQWSNPQGNCRSEPDENTRYRILIQFPHNPEEVSVSWESQWGQ